MNAEKIVGVITLICLTLFLSYLGIKSKKYSMLFLSILSIFVIALTSIIISDTCTDNNNKNFAIGVLVASVLVLCVSVFRLHHSVKTSLNNIKRKQYVNNLIKQNQ